MSYEEALYYAGGIVAVNALGALVINQFYSGGFYMGMKVRVAVCSVIYRKSLRLSRSALGETAVGKVVNLLSNDVNRFDLVSLLMHSMWTAPLMALIVGYLLFIEVGWAGMIGIAVVFIVVPLQCTYLNVTRHNLLNSFENQIFFKNPHSLHWKIVVDFPTSDGASNGRACSVNGRNHFRCAGDQDVRVGASIYKAD